MKYSIFAIRDRVSEIFSSPVFEEKTDVVRRNLAISLNESSRSIAMAQDLELFRVAEIDLKTGIINPLQPVEFICRCSDLVGKE